jgi:UDPglucose--hexose-1-phosphate uridylyltransferase
MAGSIEFRIIERESTFLDPQREFSPTVESFQVRVDPLTGRTGHFSHFGAVKPQKLDLEAYETPAIKGFCPFCLENRDRVTPKFTKNVIPEGRLKRNEACLIPNLFPYDIHSGVLIMTDPHVVPLELFNEKRLSDAFSLGTEFLKRIKSIDPSLPYHLMTWNYMPPSGGGLVHPHQQYLATTNPGNQYLDELRASGAFSHRSASSFWSTFMEEEQRRGERYIGALGTSHWISSFVSLGILGEIMCVFPDVFSINDFKDIHLQDLVSGLLNVFKYYIDAGIYSFNASLFFGPESQNYFPCHLRIIPRTFLNLRDCASDLNFFQSLLLEPVSVVMPEELCTAVKEYF